MKSTRTHNVRVLSVTDFFQRKALMRDLSRAVAAHKPDVVALVDDALKVLELDAAKQLSAME